MFLATLFLGASVKPNVIFKAAETSVLLWCEQEMTVKLVL